MRRAALVAELLRTALGGAGFLLIARSLPLSAVGVIASVSAVALITSPLILVGLPLRLVREPALRRGTDFRSLIFTALLVSVPTTAAVGALLAATGLIRAGRTADIVLVTLAESSVVLGSTLFTAYGTGASRGSVLVLSALLAGVPRLSGAVAAVLIAGERPLASYGAFVAITSFVLIAVCMSRTPRSESLRVVPISSLWRPSRQQVGCAGSALLSRTNDDLDKVLLQQLVSASQVALYSVPYRLTFYAMIPGRAILTSRLAPWFAADGRVGIREVVLPLARAVGLSSICVAALLAAWGALASTVLPGEYGDVRGLLPIFGLAIIFRLCHYFGGEVLSAQGRQGVRVVAQVVGLITGAAALLVLGGRWGIVGAAWATVVADAVIAAGVLRGLASRRALVDSAGRGK